MKKSVKMALATGAVVVVGGVVLAGTSFADGGFGFGPGMRGMGHGPMGFGAVRTELMKEVDTNKDGKLSQDEIDAAVNARFTEFDADKNGSLSLDEFQALWAEITKPATVRAFQFLDPNGDAAVSKDELDSALGSIVSRFDRNASIVRIVQDLPGSQVYLRNGRRGGRLNGNH